MHDLITDFYVQRYKNMSANRKIGKGVVYGDPAHLLVLMKKHRKICLSKWKKLLFLYFKCF